MEHERGAFKVNRRMKVGAVKKSCPKGMFLLSKGLPLRKTTAAGNLDRLPQLLTN
jgi:hypothetical protein